MSLDASFRALNRYICRKIIDILRRRGPQSVAEIHSRIKVGSRASVSQSLALLLKAEMVSVERKGRNHLYQLRPRAFKEAITYLERFQIEEPSSSAFTHS
jgi:DNA-binding transcriptional ArsR family regulator